MHSVLDAALDCVVGALEKVPGPTGVTFHRTPAAARAQLADERFDHNSSVPSGVRLEMLTDAPVVEMEVELTRWLRAGTTSPGSAFDVVVDGELGEPVVVGAETLVLEEPGTLARTVEPSGPATARWQLGGSARLRRVEIWLPASASLVLRDVRVPEGTTVRPAPPAGPLWVHHGSSISQCVEADRPTGTWPAVVARRTALSLVNLGIGGQCHLDQFMARAIRDLPASTISLELGINVVNADTLRERTFVPAFHGFLDTIRDGHPDTPVHIVTPIVCPVAEQVPGPTIRGSDGRLRVFRRQAELGVGALSLSRVRQLLTEHVALRRATGDTQLHLVDGLALFGPDDLDDLPDELHPNAAGYRRMADRFPGLAVGAARTALSA
jgi:hypothetical protein